MLCIDRTISDRVRQEGDLQEGLGREDSALRAGLVGSIVVVEVCNRGGVTLSSRWWSCGDAERLPMMCTGNKFRGQDGGVMRLLLRWSYWR